MQQLNTIHFQGVDKTQAPHLSSDGMQSLEETIGVALVGDLDSQIQKMGQDMRASLGEKKRVRAEMDVVRGIADKTPTSNSSLQNPEIIISAKEKNQLDALQMNTSGFELQPDGTYKGPRNNIGSFLETKKEELLSLNSDSEITYLQLQGLMDQRKTAFTLLSNLMAAESETTAAIVRNIKV